MSFSFAQLIPAIPELFMTVMILMVMLTDLFLSQRWRNIAYFLSQFTLVICTIVTIELFQYPAQSIFHGSYITDQVASILKLFIYGMAFLTFLYGRHYVRERHIHEGEYYLLSLFSVLGMMVLASAYSCITLFVGLELFSLPLYALIAMHRDSRICSEAAMKYFVTGSAASGFLLFGMSLAYGMAGSLNIQDIANAVGSMDVTHYRVMLLGLVFVIAAIAFKLGAVPFHMWIPDIYEGAPISVTLFIASAVKVAAFALVVRLLIDGLPAFGGDWQKVLIVIAILSMALGNITAIAQNNIRRMLAYSSIAHMGYMFLGILSGIPSGYGAALFYMVVYALMSLGAFGILTLLSREGMEIHSIEDLRGLNTRSPWLAFLMLLVMFSMAGIPPSVGFFAKIGVLMALVHVHLVWLAALALIFAIIGAYYYLKVVKVMYFDAPHTTAALPVQSMSVRLGISVNCLLVLVLGVLPTGLFKLCQAAFGVML